MNPPLLSHEEMSPSLSLIFSRQQQQRPNVRQVLFLVFFTSLSSPSSLVQSFFLLSELSILESVRHESSRQHHHQSSITSSKRIVNLFIDIISCDSRNNTNFSLNRKQSMLQRQLHVILFCGFVLSWALSVVDFLGFCLFCSPYKTTELKNLPSGFRLFYHLSRWSVNSSVDKLSVSKSVSSLQQTSFIIIKICVFLSWVSLFSFMAFFFKDFLKWHRQSLKLMLEIKNQIFWWDHPHPCSDSKIKCDCHHLEKMILSRINIMIPASVLCPSVIFCLLCFLFLKEASCSSSSSSSSPTISRGSQFRSPSSRFPSSREDSYHSFIRRWVFLLSWWWRRLVVSFHVLSMS
jgi:hypothetical protein